MRSSAVIRLAVLAAGALAAGAGAMRFVHARPAPSAAKRTGAGGSALAGRQLIWDVTLDTRLQQSGDRGSSGAGTTTLSGEWVMTVSGASDAGYDLACELRRPQVTGQGFGDVDRADVERLERRLTDRFWVSYRADGAATRLHFPREMKDDVRNFLELLVTEAQLVRPARPATQWTSTERDGAGAYFAAYQAPAPHEIVKRKIRYLSSDGTGAARASAATVLIKRAEARFTLDPAGDVSQLDGHEEMRIDAQMGAPGLDVEVRLRLDHVRVGSASELVGSLERARSGVESGPVVTQRASEEELRARNDARLIKSQTVAGVLQALEGGHPDGATRSVLEALLRQRPMDVPAALAFARQGEREPSKMVLQALGAAGTPVAQEALCGLAADPGAPAPLRASAVGALVQTTQPTASTISALIRLMDEPESGVRRQALFIAGAAGSHSHDRDREASDRIETELLARYAKCHDAGCLDLLVALGNLATPKTLPPIEQALHDSKSDLRAGAARALRKVEEPAADRLIATTMLADQDPKVRAAAILAATFRPIGPLVEPLARVVQADPVDYVRTDAIEAVANHIAESPFIEKVLLAAATGDRSPGVRRLARRALGPRLATADSPGSVTSTATVPR